jgi:membrane fusion protein (multidrug efflux system)
MQKEHSTTVIQETETANLPKDEIVDELDRVHDRSVTHKRGARKIVAITGALILITFATAWWWHARQYEETDDAQVDGNIYPVSARITGHISAVYVQEGQLVKAGAPLVEIDSRDVPVSRVGSSSQIRGAEAEFDRAEAGVTVALKGVEEAQARLIDARSAATTANSDLQRYQQLVAKGEISQQQYDQAKAAADAANARVSGAEAAVRSAVEQVRQARAHLSESTANLENARVSPKSASAVAARANSAQYKVTRAHAALEQAELNLSYTKIVAPVDGIIGRRAAQVGQNVQPGEDLMALVPLDDLWITANYKEDQLAHMRPGQKVFIHVDAYDRDWTGTVTNIGGATGARYSLLPPENATGNYVKVVQRIPVRIDLTGEANKEGLLRPGMSVVPKVRIR